MGGREGAAEMSSSFVEDSDKGIELERNNYQNFGNIDPQSR